MIFSADPNFLINEDAVLGPIPSTPGMLSDLSPTKARKSMNSFGYTLNFSYTPL